MTKSMRKTSLLGSLWDNPKSRVGLVLVMLFTLYSHCWTLISGRPTGLWSPLEPPSLNFGLERYSTGAVGTGSNGTRCVANLVGWLFRRGIGHCTGFGNRWFSGYFGGWIDSLLSLLINVFLLLGASVDGGDCRGFHQVLSTLCVVLGLTGWAWNARVVRAQVATMREREFVLASQLLGRSHLVILCTEIFAHDGVFTVVSVYWGYDLCDWCASRSRVLGTEGHWKRRGERTYTGRAMMLRS